MFDIQSFLSLRLRERFIFLGDPSHIPFQLCHLRFRCGQLCDIPGQQLVLETPGGAKLYTHPNGAEYARAFLKSFGVANPDFFSVEDLSEERFTRMGVMTQGTIMGLSANHKMTDQQLEELVESLIEIKEK